MKFFVLPIPLDKLSQKIFYDSRASGTWFSRYPKTDISGVFLFLHVIVWQAKSRFFEKKIFFLICLESGSRNIKSRKEHLRVLSFSPLGACQPPDWRVKMVYISKYSHIRFISLRFISPSGLYLHFSGFGFHP